MSATSSWSQILVGIPCYRDGVQLLDTLKDIYRNAQYSERLRVAICFQGLFPDLAPDHNSDLLEDRSTTESSRARRTNSSEPKPFEGELDAEFAILKLCNGGGGGDGDNGDNDTDDSGVLESDLGEFEEAFRLWAGKHVHVKRLHWSAARGPCLARRIVQDMLLDFGTTVEGSYYLQIDSHTKFASNWDRELVQQLAACPCDGPALLSTYPADFASESESPDGRPTTIAAGDFGEDRMLRLIGKSLSVQQARPFPTFFCVAGFLFAPAQIISQCIYDSSLDMLFFGEEALLSARLWTHGWSFFAPGKMLVWHNWKRKGRATFWNDLRDCFGDDWFDIRRQKSLERVSSFLAGITLLDRLPSTVPTSDPGDIRDWLGPVRSLRSYCEKCGVDFAQLTASEDARRGGAAAGLLASDLAVLFAQFQRR